MLRVAGATVPSKWRLYWRLKLLTVGASLIASGRLFHVTITLELKKFLLYSCCLMSSLGHKVVLHGTVPGCPSAVGPLEPLITVLRIHIVHHFVGLHHVDLHSPGLQAGHAQLSQFFLVGCSS